MRNVDDAEVCLFECLNLWWSGESTELEKENSNAMDLKLLYSKFTEKYKLVSPSK